MSEFKIRGFIEGFYGRVWNDEKRRRVLKLVADGGMNSYFYAPKDDKYLRAEWRKEYDENSLSRFSDLLGYTKSLGIDLWYCISPGLSIEYGSDDDFDILLNKIFSLYKIGVKHFGLFLDDIPEKLTHKGDSERFKNVCEAHIFLINRLFSRLPDDVKLAVCPLVYHGRGNEEYIVSLCGGIPSDVLVFWTGKKICSPELTSADAKAFSEFTGRKPLYWDNFPVNDAEMYGEMHIAPYLNRDGDLCEYAEGIVSNVMEYPLCSAVSLLTICDYLTSPESYEPEKSFEKAVVKVTGDSFSDWAPFLDFTRFSCQNDCFGVMLSDFLSRAEYELSQGCKAEAAAVLDELIQIYNRTFDVIKNNSEMYQELKKWLGRFEDITDILNAAELYITDCNQNNKDRLCDLMTAYNQNAYKLAGFELRQFVEGLLGEFTV